MVRFTFSLIAILVIIIGVSGIAEALSGYAYYISVDIENTSEEPITTRVAIPINSEALIDGNFMKADASDVELEGGSGIEYFTARDIGSNSTYWYTDIITIPANSISKKAIWLNNPSATKDQAWIASSDDSVTISDSDTLDITSNFTIEADCDFVSGSDGYIVNKPDAYYLKVVNNTLTGGAYITPLRDFNSSNSDGYLLNYDSSFSVARTAPSAIFSSTGSTNTIISTSYTSSLWYFRKSYFYFDTTTIPDGATINSAILKLYCKIDDSNTDFDVIITNGQPTYPHDPLQLGDYNYTYYSGNGGSINTSELSAPGWFEIDMNATGRGWINKEGTTKLMLLTSFDYNNDDSHPEVNSLVTYTNDASAYYRPKLSISYSVANPSATEVSTAISPDTDYNIKLTYDNNNLKLYLNDTEQDSYSNAGSIVTNSNNMTALDFDGRIDNLKIGNTSIADPTWCLDYSFEPTQISSDTISDQSGNGNDATYTLAGNPEDITVTVYELTLGQAAEASYSSEDMALGLVTEAPPQPSNFYGAEDDWGNLPGSEVLDELIGESGLPTDFIYLFFICVALVTIGYFVYSLTKDMFTVGVIGVMTLAFCATVFPSFGWVMLPIYLIVALAMIVMQRQVNF